eukprot:CAMPEP_0118700350 /NCGR_PEP_ID=MMETSP0800-20121206/16522_1 /TAXON_ID=210618 ORGANISM="Striatella unipunctata, Strain CCMP2910" /NCGR_SAMPLE_ID=MMETSP0800 /ASSEMBLY_ACC=CAM_ASM_000638 /LENGTH=90 /DNA_ID=CAMNT_0006600901 /DNA_START=77 /DNA_END=349 /DNA_ORIENTATION=-
MAIADTLTNLLSPAFYGKQFTKTMDGIGNHYRPLVKQSSAAPLFHFMLFTSLVMYTTNYIGAKGPKVQKKRLEAKSALAEYYEKHGHSDH